MLWDCGIQSVILYCPQMHWNRRYSFALSSLKVDKSICWWVIIKSLTQWSCLFIGTDASHIDLAFISLSLSVRCIKVHDPLVSPTVCQSTRSVYFVVLPSVSTSSFCIHGFMRIHLPWVVTTFLSSWYDYWGTAVRSFLTLQMLFWFGPPYFDWVEARRRIDTCSIPLVRASGTKDIE